MKPISIDKIDKDELEKTGARMLEFSINFDVMLNQCDFNVDRTIEIMNILYPKEE